MVCKMVRTSKPSPAEKVTFAKRYAKQMTDEESKTFALFDSSANKKSPPTLLITAPYSPCAELLQGRSQNSPSLREQPKPPSRVYAKMREGDRDSGGMSCHSTN